MKSDNYTKIVLTVIAGCLVLQTLERFIPSAIAQGTRPIAVTICNTTGSVCADIRRGSADALVVAPQ